MEFKYDSSSFHDLVYCEGGCVGRKELDGLVSDVLRQGGVEGLSVKWFEWIIELIAKESGDAVAAPIKLVLIETFKSRGGEPVKPVKPVTFISYPLTLTDFTTNIIFSQNFNMLD